MDGDYRPLWERLESGLEALEARIAALEEKLASYDVRLKVLENLDAQADTDEFTYFWKQYPRKVGKGHARKAFEKACKKASFDTIMDGLAKYQREKPAETAWKHPATWLNSEGWEDEWTETADSEKAGISESTKRLAAAQTLEEARALGPMYRTADEHDLRRWWNTAKEAVLT